MGKPAMGKQPAKAAIRWSSLVEHICKAALYSLLVVHAARSLLWHQEQQQQRYLSAQSAMHFVLALVGLRLVASELRLIILRLQRRLPPGLLGIPILRDVEAILAIATGQDISKSLLAARTKYGTVFARSFFGRTHIVVGGADDIQWLFNNDRKAATEIAWPPNIVRLLGPGAVANQVGSYHRTLRRLLEPYFAPTFVRNYLSVMDETTLFELDEWEQREEFVPSEVFKMYALKLFYASSFGTIDDDVISQLHDDFTIWIAGFLSPTDRQIPGTAFDEAMKARDRILATVHKLIDKFEADNAEDSERAQTTIIGRLIYGKDKDNNRMMTRDEMADNILNLIFAGHDTTYASISTLLYHLTQNPDAMESLAEEVSKLQEPLDLDELRKAPILNACMYESWRMDPPVAGSFRKAVKEVAHKGYRFDRGTVFNYSVLMASTDENQYTNHGKFQMERFLPKGHPLYRSEMDSEIDPSQGRAAYPIFGGGTHVCLGKAFAQMEMRVFAARMLMHYRVEVRNAKKVHFPVNGWNVEFKLTKRNKKDL